MLLLWTPRRDHVHANTSETFLVAFDRRSTFDAERGDLRF
jgi:hypothetical protein